MTQEEYLAHHGILGQKWGVRRYQNSDGSLTEAGKKRYAKSIAKAKSIKEAQSIAKSNVSSADIKELKTKQNAWSASVSKVESMEKSQEFKNLEREGRKQAKASAEKLMRDHPDLASRGVDELTNDEYWGSGFRESVEMAYRKSNPKYNAAVKESDRAWKDYEQAQQKVADSLVGKYGNIKMKNLPDWQKRLTVRNVVNTTSF